jgi:SNF2 family DNA or RNA helicase
MERIGITDALTDVWYVGPKSGVKVIKRELIKWDSPWRPRAFTYEALVKYVLNWKSGTPPPRLLILDESSKVKTPTAQRSEAAMHVATAVREHWGDQGYVIEMSGTPAPRVPTDWWNQCQIAQPGFLKEGNVHKFKLRMCIIEQREGGAGGTYPHIVTWLDDDKKCSTCGAELLADAHTDIENEKYHTWQKSKNEVSNLHARMKGLVLVQFKKDCLDLPEKIFEIIDIKPSVDMLRACKLVTKTSRRAIEALTRLRELSDGFQYENIPTGETEECPVCHGGGSILVPILPDQDEFDVVDPTQPQDFSKDMVEKEVCCDSCGGKGDVKKYRRETVEVGTPKDDILIQALEDHNEVGRHIVWGGFTGTIDRIVRICHQHGWSTLRVDGRGYIGEGPQGETLDSDDLLDAMDGSNPRRAVLLEAHPKLAFVGHPKAGGMALTLTMAPTMDFFSNDFSGEARMQASERHHRAGMDLNRAARIRDYIHLPSDRLVLDNLLRKKRLQDMAMGELNTVINSAMEAIRDD